MIDLVLWDLDETLLPTEGLREVRHGDAPCDLTRVPAYAGVSLHDGVHETMRGITRVRSGLVTTSPRWYVEQILAEHLPTATFDVVVTYEDVANIKPHPESLQLALMRLGTSPERALYIGDDLVDHQACMAAGVRFVGAGWADAPTFPKESEILEHPLDLLELLEAE